MDTKQIIDELEQTAQQLGFAVRREKGNFRGGRCQKGDTELIMLNKRHLPETQLAVLAEALRDNSLNAFTRAAQASPNYRPLSHGAPPPRPRRGAGRRPPPRAW